MDWSQYLYLVFLAIGCGAAISVGRWPLAFVMALNFPVTAYLHDHQVGIAVMDVLSGAFLVTWLKGVRNRSVGLLFALMVIIGTLPLSQVTYSTTLDIIAYSQIIIMGGGGFGIIIRNSSRWLVMALRLPNLHAFRGKTYPKRHVALLAKQDKKR